MLKKHVRCCRNIKNRKSEKAIGFSEVVEILLRVDVGARLHYGEKVGAKEEAMGTDHNT